MFGSGEFLLSHFFRVLPDRLADRVTQLSVLLNEPGPYLAGDSKHIVQHQHLAVTVDTGADTNGGNSDGASDLGRNIFRNTFQHYRESAGVLQSFRIGNQLPGRGFLPALELISAKNVNML